MALDYALLNFAVTIATLLATFAFRKRILAALGKLLLRGLLSHLGAPPGDLWVEEVSKAEDGSETRVRALSGPWKAYVAGVSTAVAPFLIAALAKNIKLKLPTGGGGSLPAGLDLSNLSEALPAILPMLPKRYQGIAALAAPFLSQFLGGAKPGAKGKETANPFLKDLQP
jgi:hypothetical protein